MRKVLYIAWKDLIVAFRDTSALLLMLVAPFALTLVMVFAFGGSTDSGTGLADIPVAIVNRDVGQFGSFLVQALQSEDLADLLEPVVMDDAGRARAAVDADEAAAAVIIPETLSANMLPTEPATPGDGASEGEQGVMEVEIQIYVNPGRSISASVVRGIVAGVLNDLSAGVAGAQVAITQLIVHDVISAQAAPILGPQIGERMAQGMGAAELIGIESAVVGAEAGAEARGFNWLAYMAPSMAILFLMFTMTMGGRTILVERDDGTLPRMLTTPTTPAQVLGGKISGIYLTGLVQMVILILASALLLDVGWGSPVAVALLLVALAAAATGWGALIAAYARSPGQASILGTIVALTFGIGSGHFFAREALPEWLQTVSLVSPNAWGLEAFTTLASGGGLADIALPIVSLLVMAAVLFGVAVVLFRRQYT